MRGQGQIESLIVAGILLFVVTLFFIFAARYLAESSQAAQARAAVDLLGKEADYTYAHCGSTVRYVDVALPDGTQSVSVSNRTISMKVATSSGTTDYYVNTEGPVAGGLRYVSGAQLVRMDCSDEGIVGIGDLRLSVSPHVMAFYVQQNSSASETLTLANVWFENISGISLSKSGSGASLVSEGGFPSYLAPGSSSSFNITVAASPTTPPSPYSARLLFNSTEGYWDAADVLIYVLPTTYPVTRCTTTPSYANLSPQSYRFFSVACYDSVSQASQCPIMNWSCGAGIMFPPQSSEASTLFVTAQANGTFVLKADAGAYNCNSTVVTGGAVPKVLKPILFITQDSVPDSNEQLWIDWLNNHTSGAGYNWSFDTYPDAAVRNGSTNIYDYKMVVMAAYSQVSGIEVALTPYMQSGGVVTLLGEAAYDGPFKMGQSSALGSFGYTSSTYVTNNTHYITANQSLGYNTVFTGYYQMYMTQDDITGTHLAQFSQTNSNPTIVTVSPEGARQLCVWGAYDPTTLNANGNLLTQRTIDYCLGASYLINFTNLGPLVSSLHTVPYYPDTNSTIHARAIADDVGRGNDTIQTCRLSLDSGSWQTMNPEDGSYDQVTEAVNLSLGNLSKGSHNITVNCQDIANYWGPNATFLFNVTAPGKGPGGKIVFVTNNPNANVKESGWMNWLSTHNSAEGYNWSYDVTDRAAVVGGTFNITGYRLVIMAVYTPGVGTDAVLRAFIASGGVVLLIGDALEYGPQQLNYTNVKGASSTETQIYPNNNNHYITQGFQVRKTQITFANVKMWRNPSFNGSSLAWGVAANVKVENETSLAVTASSEEAQLVTWGPDTADSFNAQGTVLTTRVIDYCLGAKWFGGGEGPIVTSLYTDPVVPYTTSSVKINASGDDNNRGNTNVTLCQLSVDAGSWQNMSASDGAYNSMAEKVNYTLGVMTYGTHVAAVRCKNSLGLFGPTSQLNFQVLSPFTPLAFIYNGPNPDDSERNWLDWIDSHSSEKNYNWSYNGFAKSYVVEETILLSDYQVAIMSDYSPTTGLPEKLKDFISGGGVVLFLGRALYQGPHQLNYTNADGTSSNEDRIYIVNNTHYITDKQSAGYMVTQTKKGNQWRNADILGGTDVADGTSSDVRLANQSIIADRSGGFVTWGFNDPLNFNVNGTTITTRTIDYCMGARK